MKRTANLIFQHLLWRGFYFFSILILNILISRFFAAEKSGQIFYIVNNLAFLILLVGMSLESGAVYFISSGKADALRLGRFLVIWTLIAGSVAMAGWWLILRFSNDPNVEILKTLRASALFISGVLLTTYFNALFYSQREFGLPNKILCVVNAILILVLIMGNQLSWIGKNFLFLYFSAYFLQGILLMFFFFIRHPGKGNHSLPVLQLFNKVFNYSATALISNIAYFLISRMDYWFVERYCSASDLGNYIQASKLGQMLLIIPSILASTLFPLLATGNETDAGTKLESVVRVLFWINILLCLPVICFGHYLFPVIFGSSFNKMYILFVLLIPGILALSMNYPISAWFSAKDQIRVNISGIVIALIIIFISDLLILPYTGVPTASVISSAGYLCFFCYSLIKFRKDNPTSIKNFLIIRRSDLYWVAGLMKPKIPRIVPENPLDL